MHKVEPVQLGDSCKPPLEMFVEFHDDVSETGHVICWIVDGEVVSSTHTTKIDIAVSVNMVSPLLQWTDHIHTL